MTAAFVVVVHTQGWFSTGGCIFPMRCQTVAMPERYLSIADVAESLGLQAATVRRMLREGDLEGFQIGDRGIWRVAQSDLDSYVSRAKAATRRRIEPSDAEA